MKTEKDIRVMMNDLEQDLQHDAYNGSEFTAGMINALRWVIDWTPKKRDDGKNAL